jgi:hypothetical protein
MIFISNEIPPLKLVDLGLGNPKRWPSPREAFIQDPNEKVNLLLREFNLGQRSLLGDRYLRDIPSQEVI